MAHLLPRRSINKILNDIPFSYPINIAEAQAICDYVGYCVVPDTRALVWDITVTEIEPFRVEGYISSLFGLNALHKVCEKLGLDLDNGNVITLPDLSTQGIRVGLVTSTECPIFKDPNNNDCQDTLLLGDPIFLLRITSSHTLVHGRDGYIGWIENINYRPITLQEWAEWENQEHAVFVGGMNYDGVYIPGGSELPVRDENTIILPTGSEVKVPAKTFVRFVPGNNNQRKALITVANTLLGTTYDWGGTSVNGIDCSGLVQYIYQTIGFSFPRDADQQFLCGRIIGFRDFTEITLPGDLLFFSGINGGISHVAIATGPESIIHAYEKEGCVLEMRLDSEPTLKERLVSIKRIIR